MKRASIEITYDRAAERMKINAIEERYRCDWAVAMHVSELSEPFAHPSTTSQADKNTLFDDAVRHYIMSLEEIERDRRQCGITTKVRRIRPNPIWKVGR